MESRVVEKVGPDPDAISSRACVSAGMRMCGMRQLTWVRTDPRVMVDCGGYRAARSASA